MSLFSLPPSSPRSDLDLSLFMGEKGEDPTSMFFKRTLAPEWAMQSGVQLTWPHAQTDWAPMLSEVTECYVKLAYEIARREPLLIVAPCVEEVKQLLNEQLPQAVAQNILYQSCPTNDTWARDHAFLSVVSTDGIELLDFRFNGWGGKFEATLDNAINRKLVADSDSVVSGKYVDCLDFELEGGSIETDGLGTLLTTSECLLNPNRNPHMDKASIEALLAERLGVERFLWIDHGALTGDDTDSHVDTLARLCPDNVIVYVSCSDPKDEHYASLKRMEQQLKKFVAPDGKPYMLLPLPLPEAIFDEEGQRLPATYANYLVMNKAVLFPTYAQREGDDEAAHVLTKAFPDREIVGIDCRALIKQHGSLHCATMQYPKGVMKQPKGNGENMQNG